MSVYQTPSTTPTARNISKIHTSRLLTTSQLRHIWNICERTCLSDMTTCTTTNTQLISTVCRLQLNITHTTSVTRTCFRHDTQIGFLLGCWQPGYVYQASTFERHAIWVKALSPAQLSPFNLLTTSCYTDEQTDRQTDRRTDGRTDVQRQLTMRRL